MKSSKRLLADLVPAKIKKSVFNQKSVTQKLLSCPPSLPLLWAAWFGRTFSTRDKKHVFYLALALALVCCRAIHHNNIIMTFMQCNNTRPDSLTTVTIMSVWHVLIIELELVKNISINSDQTVIQALCPVLLALIIMMDNPTFLTQEMQ